MNDQTLSTQKITKTIQTPYDYHAILQLVIAKGKEMFRPDYNIDDIDRAPILKLITYFLKDENVADHLGIDLYKGLIINGPVGCGKTAIMRIMRSLVSPRERFLIRSCREISLEFMREGYQVISRYSKQCFDIHSGAPRPSCFDDLGLETDVNYFGNSMNVMADILFHRYDLFMETHMLTYLTTNMDGEELEKHYGIRLRSRLRQMCNLIAFSPDSKDKRR
jgi:hypothetical protein